MHLSADEKRALVAFLRALSGRVREGAACPIQTLRVSISGIMKTTMTITLPLAPKEEARLRAAAEARPPSLAPAPARAADAGLAPQLEPHAAQAIPVALPCCSPVINHASLPAGRPAG